uniref:Uncharacterized protein n=1 Tax=Glossina palpalis gambiensis TaxID=67801 RepID=A0A1B0ALX8_9MUSC
NFTKQIQLKPYEQNLTTNKHYCWFPIGIAVNNQSTPCNHGKEYTLRLEQGIDKLFSCHVIIVFMMVSFSLLFLLLRITNQRCVYRHVHTC